VGDTGLEPNHVSICNTSNLRKKKLSDAESGAVKCHSGDFDPDLVRVIEVWPALPGSVRQQIISLIQKGGTIFGQFYIS